MTNNNNNKTLTELDKDLMGLLQEECAEVIQVVSKINRFGLYGFIPTDDLKLSNREHLKDEIGDVLAIAEVLREQGLFSKEELNERVALKVDRLKIHLNIK